MNSKGSSGRDGGNMKHKKWLSGSMRRVGDISRSARGLMSLLRLNSRTSPTSSPRTSPGDVNLDYYLAKTQKPHSPLIPRSVAEPTSEASGMMSDVETVEGIYF